MKKITLLMLSILFVLSGAHATVFYVDPATGSDTNDGLSWATAVQTIAQANTLATASATWDDIYVKEGTITFTGSFTFTSGENIYGSFKGDETSFTQRPLADNDGNGIIEPWEFQYPTTLSSSNAGTAFILPNSNIILNGFTFTHVATNAAGGTLRTIACANTSATFENNTIKNCVLSTSMTSSIGGMLMKAQGNIRNCLFEKNQTTCTSTVDQSVMPGLEVLTNTKVTGCVFRNNKATVDFSTAPSSLNTNANVRGFVMNVAGGSTADASAHTTISNCLVYNNEAIFIGNTTTAASSNGAIVVLTAFSSSAITDSIINCTIANNKTTNMKTAGLNVIKSGSAVHWVLNNVLWNNQLGGVVKNLQIGTSLASGMIANNVINGGGVSGGTGAIPSNAYCTNNLIDLSNNNADAGDTKAPQFKNPTTACGNTTDNSTEHANWTLLSGTYLFEKGTPTTRTVDKAGVAFATPRAAGAYEYVKVTPVISWTQTIELTHTSSPLTLTASSNSSDSPITYTSSNESIVSVSGNTLTVTGEGEVTVTAHQAASNYYLAAADVARTFTVTHNPATAMKEVSNNFACYSVKDGIQVKGLQSGDFFSIYNITGLKILSKKADNPELFIKLPRGVYFITFNSKTKKVLVE